MMNDVLDHTHHLQIRWFFIEIEWLEWLLSRDIVVYNPCPGGGTGIRNRLKICRPQGHVGSIPTPGTIKADADVS